MLHARELIMDVRSRIEQYFWLFLYASLLFLIISLFRYDFFAVSSLKMNFFYLVPSLCFLAAGFLLSAVCWFLLCRRVSADITFKEAFLSNGLSVMGKYIPGKFWGVLGRAAYISKAGAGLKALTQVSLYAQVVSVWAGFGHGIIGLAFNRPLRYLLWGTAVAWTVCTLGVLTPAFRFRFSERKDLVSRTLRELSLLHELLPLSFIAMITPLFISFWLSWTAGFYFLAKALFPVVEHAVLFSLAFPFATVMGIVAIIFPGGLGVREGLLVLYLVSIGTPVEGAAIISVASRLWFLAGELSLFGVALIVKFSTRP